MRKSLARDGDSTPIGTKVSAPVSVSGVVPASEVVIAGSVGEGTDSTVNSVEPSDPSVTK
ncbi:hypothetical protein GCM10027569_84510 [Flindersiella endophytica]